MKKISKLKYKDQPLKSSYYVELIKKEINFLILLDHPNMYILI
jgi:hypothetical protein